MNNHTRLASLGQDWPRQNRCTALGVFSPLCLSCGAHPSSLAAFPSKYLQVAPYDPSVSGSPRSGHPLSRSHLLSPGAHSWAHTHLGS